jgi:hypothetical protein
MSRRDRMLRLMQLVKRNKKYHDIKERINNGIKNDQIKIQRSARALPPHYETIARSARALPPHYETIDRSARALPPHYETIAPSSIALNAYQLKGLNPRKKNKKSMNLKRGLAKKLKNIKRKGVWNTHIFE